MIKVVFFDAGGVLHVSDNTQAEDLIQELGISDAQLSELYSDLLPLLGKGQITEAQLWEQAKERFGIRSVSPDERLFTRTFEPGLKKIPGMYELVDELKALGIKVALLTNVSPQYAEVLERSGHYDPFDDRILSYEVHAWKPEPKIFEIALQRLSVLPAESLFIDDLETNVEAAARLGIHSIQFLDVNQLRSRLEEFIPHLQHETKVNND